MAYCTVSIGSGLVDSMYGKVQFPIKAYLEKRGEAFEQNSLLKYLFRMETSKHAVEGYTGETAMDDFEAVGEGGTYPSTGFEESFQKFIQNETWKQSFSVTQELVEDNQIGTMKRRANKLITAYDRTREKFGRALYVGGLVGNTVSFNGKRFDCTGADKKPVFAKDHPCKVKGAAQGNLFKDSLTAAALGKLETRMQNITGDNGELLQVAPDTIWIPNDEALKAAAFEAIGSDKNPLDSTNAFNYQYGRWNVLVDPYLTLMLKKLKVSETPWFLIDSKFLQDNDGPIFQDRVQLKIRSVLDDNNDNNKWLGRARFSGGFGDWRGVAAGGMSTGADL